MKNLIILIILSGISHFIVDAQNLTYTFNPKQASNKVDSIIAKVISTGENYISRGSNEISFSITSVEINSIYDDFAVFPNPSCGQTRLRFYSEQHDEININLVNTAGQILASNRRKIAQGFHNFNIKISHRGIYMISVIGNKNRFAQKVLNTDISDKNSIEYIGSNFYEQKRKSAVASNLIVVHFFVYSGNKITKIADSLNESKTYEVEFHTCQDGDGFNYPIVQIGEQWWMAENLRTTNYNDGTPISFLKEADDWDQAKDGAYCWYDNQEISYKQSNGALYNWYAVGTDRLCPTGWHVPSDDEWTTLTEYVGGSAVTGSILKEFGTTHWQAPNANTNDEIGFTALPNGFRKNNGNYFQLGESGNWWTATEREYNNMDIYAWGRKLRYNSEDVSKNSYNHKGCGYSIRCSKD